MEKEGIAIRKIKVNIEQIHDALAFHLESLSLIESDEHVSFTPLQIKDGMMVIYIHKNKED